MANSTLVTYAQNNEDLIINAYLKNVKNGFYVDIGAHHPTIDSVTKFFYERGWCGINIEPEPRMFRLLEQHRHRDINVKMGISNQAGKLTMRQYGGWQSGLSTFSDAMKKENVTIEDFTDVDVSVTTLKHVFTDNKVKKIDFMKIDVEGYEYNVLVSNDWEKYRPTLICIEANHITQDWDALLTKSKYTEVFFDGLNKYYLANESIDLKENFSYVDDIVLADSIRAKWNDEITLLKRSIDQLKGDMDAYKTENLRLQRDLIEQKRMVSLVRQLIKSSDAVIRHRIEKLNKPKKEQRKRIVHTSDINGASNKKELYRQIRTNDFVNYYTDTYTKERLSYRILAGSYDASSRAFFRVAKHGAGVIRKAKNVKSKK
ncbi:MAG TPA: FkbM family methyltransferase [Patescibacteria group bacterium]|nr:FkbM family methyltransferase [Patescibacteria group bacterium]